MGRVRTLCYIKSERKQVAMTALPRIPAKPGSGWCEGGVKEGMVGCGGGWRWGWWLLPLLWCDIHKDKRMALFQGLDLESAWVSWLCGAG